MMSHSDNLHALITFQGQEFTNTSYVQGWLYGLSHNVRLVFSTKLSHLAGQNWLQWLTSQAKLVNCQFNVR